MCDTVLLNRVHNRNYLRSYPVQLVIEAGIGFGIVAAGLSGAEALASVGAIGATAYLVFKPAENSLTDDTHNDETEQERASLSWSKRPFSNWRGW